MDDEMIVKDCNGNIIKEGDSVQLTRDLKVKKGNSLKRGTVFKNVRYSDSDAYVDCRDGKSTIAIKTEYLKKK